MIRNGPLLWAIILWKNAIVFHSMDKVTSSYIHILPAIVTYAIRWHPTATQSVALFATADSQSVADLSLVQDIIFGYAMIIYAGWQIVYLLKTEFFDREKLDKDDAISTSFRMLTKIYQGTKLYDFVNFFGPHGLLPMFVLTQLGYTLATYLPTYWLYSNHTLHATFIVCT